MVIGIFFLCLFPFNDLSISLFSVCGYPRDFRVEGTCPIEEIECGSHS